MNANDTVTAYVPAHGFTEIRKHDFDDYKAGIIELDPLLLSLIYPAEMTDWALIRRARLRLLEVLPRWFDKVVNAAHDITAAIEGHNVTTV